MNRSNFPVDAKINKRGHLEISGCDTVDLAREFGTPLYVMDEKTIRERCRQYKASFKSRYSDTEVIFASKALCTTAILKIIADEGLGVDVVSGGELYTALKAGCDPKKIYFHGNNKSLKEIEEGLKAGVGRFVVDCFEEIINIDEVSKKTGTRVDVLIRVNPGVEAHTHEFIQTGKIDSKFGFSKDKLGEAISKIKETKNLNLIGFHSHIGSQIFDVKSFVAEIDVLFDAAKKQNVQIFEMNIGGGFGIDYLSKQEAPMVDSVAEAVTSKIKECVKKYKYQKLKLVIEPGRSIVGTAGVTLYKIGVIKDIPGIRKYVSVDGGMADNPRPILYQASYEALISNRASEDATEKVTISGRFCESGDVLIKDTKIQTPKIGDILVVLCTGAYGYSMSSNYNRVPRPAMVLINNGNASVIVGRETYEDLLSKDVLI